ncbi:hypothetical protein GCM10010493_24450 [Streptomyces lavendulae subsp. grasserius]
MDREAQRLSGSSLLPHATRVAASRPMPPRATAPERMRRRATVRPGVPVLSVLPVVPVLPVGLLSMADRLDRGAGGWNPAVVTPLSRVEAQVRA